MEAKNTKDTEESNLFVCSHSTVIAGREKRKTVLCRQKGPRGSKLAKANEQIKAVQTSSPLVCVEASGKSSSFFQQRDSIMSHIGDRHTECCYCRILLCGRAAVPTGPRHPSLFSRVLAVYRSNPYGIQ